MDSSRKTTTDTQTDVGSVLDRLASITPMDWKAFQQGMSIQAKKTDGKGPLPSDCALLMAQRLVELGVPLEDSWSELLPDLPVRVAHVLLEINCRTLADVLRWLRNDGEALMQCKNFGRKSLNDLWRALDALATGETKRQPGLFHGSSPSTDSLFAQLSIPETPSPTDWLMDHLAAKGVELDQPWQIELPVLPTRLQKALSERFVTLREVVMAATEQGHEFLKLENLGRISLRQLREAIVSLAEHGAGYHRYGEAGAAPTTIGELITQALATLPHDEGRLLIRRCLDGLTLEQLGREYNVTRERIRQKVGKTKDKLTRRFGSAACALTDGVLARVRQAGVLLHRDIVETLTGENDLFRVALALQIAGAESVRIWRGDFLTPLSREELQPRLSAVRRGLIENRQRDLNLSLVREIVRQAAGFDLESSGLTCLLTKHFDCQVNEGGAVLSGLLRVPDRLAKILRAASRPMHISEIAEVWLVSYAAAADDALTSLRDSEDDEPADEHGQSPTLPVPEDAVSRREAVEHTLANAFYRHDDIYQCDPKTFVHADALPASREKLDELAELCVSRIEGETSPVSAEYLLNILEAAGFAVPGVNKFLLKDVLSRRPEIISLKKFRVGHIASFQEHGLTLVARLENILRAAERPLSSPEIIERLPRHIEYFPGSIVLCLGKSSFAVNLGGRYCHIESLGMSKSQRAHLVEAALAHLPEDGSPVSCSALLQRLRAEMPELELPDRHEALDILRGLLRLSGQVQSGAGYLVARRTEDRTQPLLREVIAQIVGDLILAYPRDVRRELNNNHGERQNDSAVSSCLAEGVRLGEFRRLPASLYCLSDTDDEKLLQALASYDRALRSALDDIELTELPVANMWLLARYFYQQDDLAATDGMLRRLLSRADLSAEQRRSGQRLRAVVASKM